MKIACITLEGRGQTDRFLNKIADELTDDGYRLVGALRIIDPDADTGHCDSTLRLLPDGAQVSISQNLGSGSHACRMDAGALTNAAKIAEQRLLNPGADLIVLNKFGLSEANGGGFRALIAEALGRGVPVLIGLSNTHRAAFEKFTEGITTVLPPDEEAVLTWCRQVACRRPSGPVAEQKFKPLP